jgi:Tfp pilus assembly protein PilF
LDELLQFLDDEELTTMISDLKKGERLNDEGVKQLSRMKFDKAEQSFRAAIAAAPQVPAGHNNLAIAVFCQGRIGEAIRIQSAALRKAMEIDPAYLFAPSALAVIYLNKGSVKEARALLDKIVMPDRVHPSAVASFCCAQAQVSAMERQQRCRTPRRPSDAIPIIPNCFNKIVLQLAHC